MNAVLEDSSLQRSVDGDAPAGTKPAGAEPFPPDSQLTDAQRIYAGGKPARKPRGPSKKMQAAIVAAEHIGYERGMNAPRDPWPGAISAGLLALGAFGLGAWLF